MRGLWKAIAAMWGRREGLLGYGVLLAIVAWVVILLLIFAGPPVSQIFSDYGGCLQCTSP